MWILYQAGVHKGQKISVMTAIDSKEKLASESKLAAAKWIQDGNKAYEVKSSSVPSVLIKGDDTEVRISCYKTENIEENKSVLSNYYRYNDNYFIELMKNFETGRIVAFLYDTRCFNMKCAIGEMSMDEVPSDKEALASALAGIESTIKNWESMIYPGKSLEGDKNEK